MTSLRNLGYNVQNYILNKGLTDEFIAEGMGLSVSDVHRIYEARLILTPGQLFKLAELLGIRDIFDLFKTPEGFISYGYCDGSFSDPNNEEKILSMIDDYIDLIESIS